MGCCATKPKVLKGKEAEEPLPIPAASRQQAKAKAEAKADPNHHADRRRSLSNLLEEEMRTETKTPTRLTRSKSLEDVTQELSGPVPDTEKSKEVDAVTNERRKGPMTGVDETGNRNSESVQYMKAKSVHDLVADIEKLNKPKPNVVTKNGTEEPKKPQEWMYTPIPVPVALRKIELGGSAEPNPTHKAATDTERVKWPDVVISREIEHPVQPFEQNCDANEPESAPHIPEGMIMNLKIEDIAYEIEQLYKPDMMDCFPSDIKTGKSEPEASTSTDELKHVDAITNQKIEEPSNGIEQIYRLDPADVAPGNTEPMQPKSAPETAADTETLKETNISIQPTKIEPASETAAAADTEKLKKTSVSINQEPAKPRKVLEHVHKAEQVAIA
ncbi:hypothetical protein V6N13_021224 [Hibiscus sabdariffa]|uniref:Uncharacterized protein n=1 Tax=Hibiscus sabdariffa TaxID=183260 RepID=A0ABR2EVT4_9ROSI